LPELLAFCFSDDSTSDHVFGSDGSGVSARLLHITWIDIYWRATITEDIFTSWRLFTADATKEYDQYFEPRLEECFTCLDHIYLSGLGDSEIYTVFCGECQTSVLAEV